MWLFKKKPKHISLERLSEYLDGGLGDADVRRVEGHLQACESCTEELDSLRDAVGLLRQTPVISTRRDFTFAEDPALASERQEQPASVGFPGFRVPVWAYGAAASVAVVAFAVTLSIDVTRGPDDGGGTALFSEENGDSFATTLSDPEDSSTGVPMPPTATPEPQEEPPGVTGMPVAPTSTPAAEAASIEMAEPGPETTTHPTQTPGPVMALEAEKVDEAASAPDMAMSRAEEPTSGAKVQLTGVPTSRPPPGDVAERQADAATPKPTAMPAPKPTAAPTPTAEPTITQAPAATAMPTAAPLPTPTTRPTLTPTPTPRRTSPPVVPLAPEGGMERGTRIDSVDATDEEIAHTRESLGTDRGVSVWWIVEGVLAAMALGLVVLLALKLRSRRRRVS